MPKTECGRHAILVVEDETIVRMVGVCTLEDAGFDVVEAADAAEALHVLHSRSDIGLLFTDVNMPGELDGIGLAKLVHDSWPDIQLIVTSGQAAVKASQLPENGRFIPKPFSGDEMVRLVSSVTERG